MDAFILRRAPALLITLLFGLVAVARAAPATLPSESADLLHFLPPDGWLVTSADNPRVRAYGAPDAAPGRQAAIVIAVVRTPVNADMPFDLRSAFDRAVAATLTGRTIIDRGKVGAARTRQGFDALGQTLVAQDVSGAKVWADFIAVHVVDGNDDVLAAFCFVASSRADYDGHKAALQQVLASATFDADPPPDPAANPESPATPAHPASSPDPSVAANDPVRAEASAPDLQAQLQEVIRQQRTLHQQELLLQQRLADIQAAAAAANADNAQPAADRVQADATARYARSVAARRQPQMLVGAVTGADGQPIPNATAQVQISGVTADGGKVETAVDVDGSGQFSQKLADGRYRITATCVIPFDGQRIPMRLEPVDQKGDAAEYDSTAGIVKDFRLRLTGLIPGGDPKNLLDYFGARLGVSDASQDAGKSLSSRYPRDSRIRLLLTSTGPLVDGSGGRDVPIEFALHMLDGHAPAFGNIAIGTYRVSAQLILPDGTARDLKVQLPGGQASRWVDIDWKARKDDPRIVEDPRIALTD